jgi:hypothetical protein
VTFIGPERTQRRDADLRDAVNQNLILWLAESGLLAEILLDPLDEVGQFAFRNVDDSDPLTAVVSDAGQLDSLTPRLQTIKGQLEVRLASHLQDDSGWTVSRRCHAPNLLVLLLGLLQLLPQQVSMRQPITNRQLNFAHRDWAGIGVLLGRKSPFDD